MEMFPFVMMRRAEGRFFEQSASISAETKNKIELLHKNELRRTKLRDEFCQKIYAVIGNHSEVITQKRLLKVKRKISRSKNLDQNDWDLMIKTIGPSFFDFLKENTKLINENLSLESDLSVAFENDLQSIRRYFLELTLDDQFKKGLAHSSPHLFGALRHYQKMATGVAGKKALKVERGLSKYLTRYHAKTSPFSTFTGVGFHNVLKKSIEDHNIQTGSHVRLNNHIFGIIFDLLKKDQHLKKIIPVRLNETIVYKDSAFHFFHQRDGQEVFQRIQETRILQILGEELQNLTPLGEILDQLLTRVEVDEEALDAYLMRLLACGYLEFDPGISGLDPDWTDKVIDFLIPWKSLAGVSKIMKTLKDLDLARKRYATASGEERIPLRETAMHSLKEMVQFISGGSPSPNLTSDISEGIVVHERNLFYEDLIIACEQKWALHDVSPVISALHSLNEALYVFRDLASTEMSTYERFFRQNFHGLTPILTFFEVFKRKEISPQTPKKSERHKRWINALVCRLTYPDEGIVHINLDQVMEVNKEFAPAAEPRHGSFCAFIQFWRESGQIYGVCNGGFSGFGKLMGRFLDYGFESITEKLRACNNSFAPEYLCLENRDHSLFNANMHPLLMAGEIRMPGGQNTCTPDKWIPIHQLGLRMNDSGKLELVFLPDGRPVMIFDLDFEASGRRTQLFRFLNQLTPNSDFLHGCLRSPINKKFAQKSDDCIVLPRIVFQNNLILQRKTWRFPKWALPRRNSSETDLQWFRNVESWRKSYGLPDHVFIKILNRGEQVTSSAGLDAFDYKPQYICFQNPILVNYLDQLMAKTPNQLNVIEMLPKSEHLGFGDGHVTEHLVQWHEK